MYKREEGMWARVPAAVVGGAVTVYATDAALGWNLGNMRYIWAALVFAALGLATLFLAFFHTKTGEVLIDTENEMRKVVWPSREEVSGATTVVIMTVIILGVAIYMMDIALANILSLVGLY